MSHPQGGPPQEWPPRAAGDFIDAPADQAADRFPPPGSFPDEHPATDEHPGGYSSAGGYPAAGETAEQPVVGHEPTQVIPAVMAAQSWQAQPEHGQSWEGQPEHAQSWEGQPGRGQSWEGQAEHAQSWDGPAEPAQPWHAQHEAPGQWQHTPPEHPAWPHQPPAEPAPIWSGQPPAWQTAAAAPAPRRRGALWVSLALTATLLLCGGGAASAYFLLRDADNPGSADPATAVNQFLTAVYSQENAKTAEQYVCRESRDQARLTERVDEVKTYSSGYTDPVFRWSDPAVADQSSARATVSVQLTMSTSDEKTAQQNLKFIVIHKTGWLVCEVSG